MTSVWFTEFIRYFRRHTNDRHVLLMVDGHSSHRIERSELGNVMLYTLPPNTTSVLQLMDAGIIAAFKLHVRRFQLQHAIDQIKAGYTGDAPYKVDQLTGM